LSVGLPALKVKSAMIYQSNSQPRTAIIIPSHAHNLQPENKEKKTITINGTVTTIDSLNYVRSL
jgi:hypothetical protein